jgi:hypothetical protein
MKSSPIQARPEAKARKALAEHLAAIADLQSRIANIPGRAAGRPGAGPQAPAGEAKRAESHVPSEQARLDQKLAAAMARRSGLVADVVDTELPRRIEAYQSLVLQVNAAWNDILAFDDLLQRRHPVHPSVFNTRGPHERVVLAPSTDRSPVPPLEINSRELFAAARGAADRFAEALETDAEARFSQSVQ